MAWLPLLPDASNISPILFPFHIDREKKKEKEREESRNFYVDDAELAIAPEEKKCFVPV